MEKLGMRFVRSFRLSAGDLHASDTDYAADSEVWDGEDVEYAVGREEWEQDGLGRG